MSQRTSTKRGRIAHQPALDGYRGFALLWMLFFHCEFSWAVGGFLALSTFFTLSGFLITSLFLAEWESTGTIRLGAFWSRRLRRLMPASLLTLGAIALFGVFFATPDQLARLRGDVFAALAYVANWRFLFTDTAYTKLFEAPSPLQHFWSLAVEEQFYLSYPLLALFGLRITRASLALMAAGLVALAALAFTVSCVLVQGGASVDRLYYGTDTRGLEILLGCLLAIALRSPAAQHPAFSRTLSLIGPVALLAMTSLWTFITLESRWLYAGGLLSYALLSTVVIAAAVQPTGWVRRFLSWPAFCWMGQVSYGVYLFHWPLFLILSHERTGLDPWPLTALRLSVTFALGALSYKLLETPIRTGRALTGWRPYAATPAAIAAVVIAAIAVTSGDATRGSELEAQRRALEAETPATQPSAAAQAPPSRLAGSPRVAVFGDSTALTVGLALVREYRKHRSARPREGQTQMGCGLLTRGRYRFRGRVLVRPDRCGDRNSLYAGTIATQRPDLAVVLVGPWDILDRQLGDEEWRAPGDPLLDAELLREMNEVVELLSADGALVVWLTSPRIQVRELGSNHLPNPPLPESDPARMDHFNQMVFALEGSHPGKLRVIDLAKQVAMLPGGEFDLRYRPDGIHFSEEGARELTEDWLANEILRVYREEGDRSLRGN